MSGGPSWVEIEIRAGQVVKPLCLFGKAKGGRVGSCKDWDRECDGQDEENVCQRVYDERRTLGS
jgi:hypothetical protein